MLRFSSPAGSGFRVILSFAGEGTVVPLQKTSGSGVVVGVGVSVSVGVGVSDGVGVEVGV